MIDYNKLSIVGLRKLSQILQIRGYTAPLELHTGDDKQQRLSMVAFLSSVSENAVQAASGVCKLSRVDQKVLTPDAAPPTQQQTINDPLVMRLLNALDAETRHQKEAVYLRIYQEMTINPLRLQKDYAELFDITQGRVSAMFSRLRRFGLIERYEFSGHAYSVCAAVPPTAEHIKKALANLRTTNREMTAFKKSFKVAA